MSENLSDVVAELAERLTGEVLSPEQIERLSQVDPEETHKGLTEEQKVKLGEIATQFESH